MPVEDSTPVIDAVVVEDHETPGTEIVAASSPGTLFKRDDPVEALTEAQRVAAALKGVIAQGKMIDSISGKEYVKVEGWRTLGAILGVSPQEVAMVELANGWQCTVEAVTADGRVVGRATSSCTTDETRWAKAKTFELQGMASTRATSRALRAPLGFVMQLAGYQATAAEEMSEARERGGDPDLQWDVLPEGQRFTATCESAEWKNTKNGGKLLVVARVKNRNGGQDAGEKIWLDPKRPEFSDACKFIGHHDPVPIDQAVQWAGRGFDIEVSVNGKWRNYKILPEAPVEVS